MHGGELVLSTGIALPDDPGLLAAYVAELSGAGVSGLAVELGRRYERLPDALVGAAGAHGLPLIAFRREVPFVEITETVHAMIIDAQLAELRASERVHETFTDLSVAGAPPREIVRQAALLAGCPVILEALSHRVLACAPAGASPRQLWPVSSSRPARWRGPDGPSTTSGWAGWSPRWARAGRTGGASSWSATVRRLAGTPCSSSGPRARWRSGSC